ncbi:MAG TPA: GNAT family N-acetyltransferase, partial [Tenuifilaceae bacterium]|nr:GNAT family N-acetyltransferase [Tenuifilaceae bacterium]
MEEVSIRDFELQNFDGLSEVWSLTNLGNPQRGDNLDIILQSISMGGKMLVAVNADDRVIGTSWMTFDGRRIHLHHFGVHPDYQRKGIGKLLV